MKNLLYGISVIALVLASVVFSSSAYAAGTTTCQPIYGGGKSCPEGGNILINKKVTNAKTKDAHFAPNQTVSFQITVTNNGQSPFAKITIKDVFPSYVKDIKGPGSFDTNTKTLIFEVLNLNPNETRDFTLTASVVPAGKIPITQGSLCVVNQAMVLVNDVVVNQDNAQFCIEKMVPPTVTKGGLEVFPPSQVYATPPTGPEALALFALISTGLAGQFLRRLVNPSSLKISAGKGGEN